jgi:hypothetical protein
MRSPTLIDPAPDAMRALARALHGLDAPLLARGTYALEAPVTVTTLDGATHTIAPSGDVWTQRQANEHLPRGTIASSSLDLSRTDLLTEVHAQLFPSDPAPPRATLLGVEVVDDGSASAPLDHPHGHDATLLVLLPSRFFGGELIAQDRGCIEALRWSLEIESSPSPHTIRWAAWTPSARPWRERVRQGSCVCLAYALERTRPTAPTHPAVTSVSSALEALRSSVASGATLAVPCEHPYLGVRRFQSPPDELTRADLPLLAGRDAALATAALDLRWRVRLRAFVLDAETDERWPLPAVLDPTRPVPSHADRDALLRALHVEGPAVEDASQDEHFIVEPPRFHGVPRRYEREGRAPRPLFAGLPALEPAPTDAPSTLFTWAALCVDRRTTAPEEIIPTNSNAPTVSPSAPDEPAPAEPLRPDGGSARAPARKPSAKPARKPTSKPAEKSPRKPAGKPAEKPARRSAAAPTGTSAKTPPAATARKKTSPPRANTPSASALVNEVRGRIASVLSRLRRDED